MTDFLSTTYRGIAAPLPKTVNDATLEARIRCEIAKLPGLAASVTVHPDEAPSEVDVIDGVPIIRETRAPRGVVMVHPVQS